VVCRFIHIWNSVLGEGAPDQAGKTGKTGNTRETRNTRNAVEGARVSIPEAPCTKFS